MRRISILFLFQPLFFTTLANTGDQIEPESSINWITIWLSFFFGLLFTILFRFLNRRSRTIDQRSDPGLPLSGWIIFLGVNLFIRIGVQLYFFWTAHYFSKSAWTNLAELGGVTYHSLFIFEMFLSLFALTGTGALIYWYLGRRDIFPSIFIYYVAFYLVANLMLMGIYRNMAIPPEMMNIRHNTVIQIIRIVYIAAWAVYVLKSRQVKKTFVYSG